MLRMNKNNQEGLASIFISMIMMIVITLLVLGFVQFANKEASQVLTRQLSTAAFYVAESGVNEVKSVYQQVGSNIPSKSICSNNTSSSNTANTTYIQTLGSTSNISIPCLLVSNTTNHIRDNLALGSSWITPINSGNGNINYLTIGWQNSRLSSQNISQNNVNTFCFGLVDNISQMNSSSPLNDIAAGNYNLGPEVIDYSNCDAGVIKVDLVPANNIGKEYTYYFYPQPWCSSRAGSTTTSSTNLYNDCNEQSTIYSSIKSQSKVLSTIVTAYNDYSEGIPLPGSCPGSDSLSSEYCNVTIDLRSLSNVTYYLRIKTFYLPANIEISAESSNPINPSYSNIPFQGDQIVVDSTGKVSNVLQRIRVNLAPNYNGSNGSGIVPNSALNITQGICKQFYYDGSNTINSAICNTF